MAVGHLEATGHPAFDGPVCAMENSAVDDPPPRRLLVADDERAGERDCAGVPREGWKSVGGERAIEISTGLLGVTHQVDELVEHVVRIRADRKTGSLPRADIDRERISGCPRLIDRTPCCRPDPLPDERAVDTQQRLRGDAADSQPWVKFLNRSHRVKPDDAGWHGEQLGDGHQVDEIEKLPVRRPALDDPHQAGTAGGDVSEAPQLDADIGGAGGLEAGGRVQGCGGAADMGRGDGHGLKVAIETIYSQDEGSTYTLFFRLDLAAEAAYRPPLTTDRRSS